MVTRRLKITGTNRTHPIPIVRPTDFVYENGDPIEPEEVVRNPAFSVYCINPEDDTVLFVEATNPAVLDRAAFYYGAQFEQAKGLVSMPIETFHRVAKTIPQPPKGLILVHSVGRCGSTLVSKALAAAPSVYSLSEPDDLTQMVQLRGRVKDDAWLRPLMESSIRWRNKSRIGGPSEFLAIKTRSEVFVLVDLFGELFPTARHLFLYRDGVAWMGSAFAQYPADRPLYDPEENAMMEQSWSDTIPILREYIREGAPLNPVQIRMLAWITCMEAYLSLSEIGVPLCAVRYEDLLSESHAMLRKIFEFCEIEDVDWTEIDRALAEDSQAGTVFSREVRRKNKRELTPELIQDIHDLVATRPLLRTADVILPGTATPGQPTETV